MAKKPKKPEFKTERATEFWRHINAEYLLERHQFELLMEACQAIDHIESARAVLERDGEYFTASNGAVRPHPAGKVEIDNRILLSRLLRELRLDSELPADTRQPRLRG